MSSAESKSPRSPKTSSSAKAHADAHPADRQMSPSSNVPLSVEPSSAEPMDQHPDSPTIAPPPALPTSPEVMSSTAPDPLDTVSLSQPSPASPGMADIEPSESPTPQKPMAMRQQPIPPASEPMQYRAIGLVRGKYAPSDEQFTRGFLVTDDGVSIDAVLLGRVMSLVKKHLDLEQSHLWVVYPRTREKEYDLHVQIVGVWEPENLNSTIEADEPTDKNAFQETAESDLAEEVEAAIDKAVLPATALPATASPVVDSAEALEAEETATGETAIEASLVPAETPVEEPEEPIEDFDDRYFSVRGEVVFHSPENEQVLVKIRRIQRQGDKQSKAFKVVLRGALEGGKSVGYFWEFNVQRQENILTIQDATLIKMVPPQKGEGGNKFSRGPRRGAPPGGRKRWDAGSESAPPRREGAVPRPSRPVGDRPSRPVSERPLGSDRPVSDRPVSDRPSKPAVPRERKEPATKPVLKRRNSEPSES